MTTQFLSNDTLWHEITTRAESAARVRAAVAFVGSGGATLLPLKKGDTLVVNLGMRAVTQGLTCPSEIQKLMRRGVQVFTRATLHAKFFVFDRMLVVGSANVSRNSRDALDEAGSLTSDVAALRRAQRYFEQLCTEPVGPEYLKQCLKAYSPPRFSTNGSGGGSKQRRVVEAKLWFIGGLRYINTPRADADKLAAIEQAAQEKLSAPDTTEVRWIRYPTKRKFLDHLRTGDWVVSCLRDLDGARFVEAPAQVLGVTSYRRNGAKRTYVVTQEAKADAEAMTLAQFRQRVRRLELRLDKNSPRTLPILNVHIADEVLRLWTPSGRVSKRRGRARV